LTLAVFLAALGGTSAPGLAARGNRQPVVARLEVLEGAVDVEMERQWRKVDDSVEVRLGSRIRARDTGAARLDFPWMWLVMDSGTTITLPADRILSAVLESGRVEQRSSTSILKVRTPEAEVRGRGAVIVRRVEGATHVTSLEGTVRVAAPKGGLTLARGEAAVVRKGSRTQRLPLPASPAELWPGVDPVYVKRNDSLRLRWRGAGVRYHVVVMTIGGDLVLSREAPPGGMDVALPQPGLYRWRVSSVAGDGAESLPSAEGWFCVWMG